MGYNSVDRLWKQSFQSSCILNTLAHQQENLRGNCALARIASAVIRLIDWHKELFSTNPQLDFGINVIFLHKKWIV
jgi:hypothetical protein